MLDREVGVTGEPNQVDLSRIDNNTGFLYDICIKQALRIKGCPVVFIVEKNSGMVLRKM